MNTSLILSGSTVQFLKISLHVPPPQRINGNSRGWGVAKAEVFKEKYGAKLEILGRWGMQIKNLSVGGGGRRTTHWIKCAFLSFSDGVPLLKPMTGQMIW